VKTLYELLGIGSTASADDIKRAFRREIARYHPDKVLHLGIEFQQLAAERTAELTEAYRVLSDADLRADYDRQLQVGAVRSAYKPAASPPPEPPRPAASEPSPRRPQAPPPGVSNEPPPKAKAPAPAGTSGDFTTDAFKYQRLVRDDYVKKEALKRLRGAVLTTFDEAEEYQGLGFEITLLVRPRRGFAKLLTRPLLVCGRYVPRVDPAAIQDAWTRVIRLGRLSRDVALFLLANELAPQMELTATMNELTQRLGRVAAGTRIIVVPLDVHDWKAILFDDTPPVVRMVLDHLPKQ